MRALLLEIGTEYKKYFEHKALKHHREKNKRWTKRKSFERQKRSQVELSDNLPWKRALSPLSDMWSQHWKHDFGDNIWWAAQTELCLKYSRNFLFIYKHPTFALESETEYHKMKQIYEEGKNNFTKMSSTFSHLASVVMAMRSY